MKYFKKYQISAIKSFEQFLWWFKFFLTFSFEGLTSFQLSSLKISLDIELKILSVLLSNCETFILDFMFINVLRYQFSTDISHDIRFLKINSNLQAINFLEVHSLICFSISNFLKIFLKFF